MKTLPIIVLIAFVTAGCSDAKRSNQNASQTDQRGGATADRDNTAVNVRDRDAAVKTPIDQKENRADLDVTAKIRKRVMDTNMSVNAKNVKIITQDGEVTLRGPVKSTDEKKQIEEIARDVAGAKVNSQLEVE